MAEQKSRRRAKEILDKAKVKREKAKLKSKLINIDSLGNFLYLKTFDYLLKIGLKLSQFIKIRRKR